MAGILRNVRLFAGGVDLTGQSNKIDFSAEVDERDVTTWGDYDSATDSVWKAVKGGISSGKVTAEGVQDYALVDAYEFAALGGLQAWSWYEHTAEVGSPGYLASALEGSYQPLAGEVGAVNTWKTDNMTSGVLARGKSLHAPGTARTATGTGTAVQLRATGAHEAVHACAHVLSVAGTSTPTITLKVASDSVQAFSATPEDRVTFAARTTIGGEAAASSGGANADTWYRVGYTISGTSPSFLVVVTVGIGPAA